MSFEFKELGRDIGKTLFRFFSHRILWLLVITAVLFYILLAQLFQLQIVEADTFQPEPPRTATVTRPIAAPRGTIYDRHGRPLAVNQLSFVVKMDPSVEISNEALLELALLFERNDERFVDEFPISREAPFEFLFTGPSEENIRRQEHRWKDDMAVPNPWYATAEETWEFLRSPDNRHIRIDETLSDEDARRILNFRAPIFMQRLHNWDTYMPMPIIFAYDVSHATIAAIEENNALFTGVFVDTQTLRYYPAGRYMSHMVGYLRPITAAQLEANEHLGYTAFDLFGRAGLELSMEHFLRGQPGIQSFEVDGLGRRISTPVWDEEPQPGSRVFLTIDLALQEAAFHVLEDYLSEALIRRLNFHAGSAHHVSLQDVFINYVRGYHLDVRRLLEVEADNHAYPLLQYILARDPEANTQRESISNTQGLIIEGIHTGRITPAQMLLALIGTEQITDLDGTIATQLIEQPASALNVLIEKIRARELTPHVLNTDPSTGSAMIVCVQTGDVLAAVTYPSFDNNRLVNDFDSEYFRHINTLDPTHPMRNRPFMEAIAPGSTFKMFTAVAALEAGAIGPSTRIFDGVNFTSAGNPPVRCWHRGGHGSINVAQAIAVSCNYFFAESAFRLGNTRTGTTMQGIQTLNDYMAFFGLNSPTGVQIGERHLEFARTGFEGNQMASPELKEHMGMLHNPFSARTQHAWRDGDTVQVSFGQGYNAYTAAQMARGMAIIGNRGNTLPLTLVGNIENSHGTTLLRHEPTPEEFTVTVSESTWDAVFDGMRLATQPGVGGTAVGVFRNFPVAVAGKTGTAEHGQSGRFSHTAFGGFAPYENPQVAIYVNIPFGSTQAFSQLSAHIARDLFALALGIADVPEHPEPLNNLRV
ncbi:MAG: penicillin-binding transpeptidase domain-containing protein [Defluviitaleaceae bacterium]|nr:penicillin-binding transpeptidase domain-containing protein [Defluviitaleaceae bacterium]